MSAPFLIQRGEERYQALGEEQLIAWAREGRVQSGDLLFVPAHGAWQAAESYPPLTQLLLERSPYLIQRGTQRYPVPSIELLQEWLDEGRIAEDDQVWSAAAGRSFTALELSGLSLQQRQGEGTRQETPALEQRAPLQGSEAPAAPEARTSSRVAEEIKQLQAESAPEPPAPPPEPGARAAPARSIRPLYDAVRVFVAARTLRPGERLARPARLSPEGPSLEGEEKRTIFERLIAHLEAQRALPLDEAQRAQLEQLIELLKAGLPQIGARPPERLVVGHGNAPMMCFEERALMEELHQALGALIRLGQREQSR